eukprot:m.153203 g.153203  ORF g.153203 m.153203 type:complete len:100 (+) comp10173_c0_seq2:975-1274(+)
MRQEVHFIRHSSTTLPKNPKERRQLQSVLACISFLLWLCVYHLPLCQAASTTTSHLAGQFASSYYDVTNAPLFFDDEPNCANPSVWKLRDGQRKLVQLP